MTETGTKWSAIVPIAPWVHTDPTAFDTALGDAEQYIEKQAEVEGAEIDHETWEVVPLSYGNMVGLRVEGVAR